MTYWNNDGQYQKAYDALYKKLVPDMGNANSAHGELLRNISKLYHDWYNNGWGNLDVLSSHWNNIVYWRDDLFKLGMFTPYEYGNMFDLVGFRWSELEDSPRGEYDEIPWRQLPTYLESLLNTIIVYAALKEVERV